jgi:predicted Na+-dependent transporter
MGVTWAEVTATLRQQWALVAVLATMGVAAAEPTFGSSIYKVASKILIVTLFAILGLTLNLSEMRNSMVALQVHVPVQLFSLVLTPTLYYLAVFRWRWEVPGILCPSFAAGTMAALVMPTTTNTNVLFTQQAGGDVPIAVVNAAVGNILGAVVSPLMAMAFLGGQQAHQDLGSILFKLSQEILLPLLIGLVVQISARWCYSRYRSREGGGADTVKKALLQSQEEKTQDGGGQEGEQRGGQAPAVERWQLATLAAGLHALFKMVEGAILVILFYLIFCKAFDRKHSASLSARAVAALIGWISMVHLLVLATAWGCSCVLVRYCRMQPKQQVAFMMVAPQKTEGMALAILAVIFANDKSEMAMLTLPVVVYHSVQMLVAAMLMPWLRRIAAGEEDHRRDSGSRASTAGPCPASGDYGIEGTKTRSAEGPPRACSAGSPGDQGSGAAVRR